ncbi:hypothetical protein [Bradyrhizobium genosp. SA-3]|uniref:hypothetical protein n=1 Tax=Bradyrhizobium genosp. SA-3 TaxID=508868 RepID=UPI0010293CAD|nr:hypothetical protein [Bradyrhizobium genosp. SA-3]
MEFLKSDKPHLGTPRTPSPVPTPAPQNQTTSTGAAGIVRLVCKGITAVKAWGNGYSENSANNFEAVVEIDFNARTLKRDGLTYKDVEISETEVSAEIKSSRYRDPEGIERIKVNRITGGYSGYWTNTAVPGTTAFFSREAKCVPAPEKLF